MERSSLLLERQEAAQLDLSIVIPIYNDTLKFHNVLTSYRKAFEGSSVSYELVIVDNNSPKIAEIVSLILTYKESMNLVFVQQPKLLHPFSLCGARNRGVANARGTYIFFTDSDCMIDQAFVRSFEQLLQKRTEQVAIFTGERVFVKISEDPIAETAILATIPKLERTPSASNYGKEKDRRFPWIENLPDQAHPWNFVHGCFILLKKEDYLAVGGSDTRYDGNWGYEEIDLIYRMVSQLGAKVYYLPEAKVFHQELPEDLKKIGENAARTNKSQNPNYLRICELIEGFDDFKKLQWDTLKVKTS